MRRGIAWAAACGFAICAALAAPSRADDADGGRIQFLERRVKEHPADPTLPARLATALLERAGQTHDHTLYVRAEAACVESLKRDPEYAPALVLLGSSRLGRHAFKDALASAERALAMHPRAADAIALRGDALFQLGDLAKARADYERLLMDAPDLLAHVRMGHLRFAEGDAAGALESFNAGLRAGEASAAAPALMAWGLVRMGEFYFRTGKWDEAGRCYADALELLPDDADVLDHAAELHAARGEFDKALELSARAIAVSPRPELQQARGDILAAKGDAAGAKVCHEKALAAYLAAARAGHAHYYHHLAGLLCDVDALRDPAAAVRWAEKDLEVRRTPATLDALAWALYHASKPAEAAALLDGALSDKLVDAHILYDASLIYARAGDPAKGRSYLERAAKANPRFMAFHVHR